MLTREEIRKRRSIAGQKAIEKSQMTGKNIKCICRQCKGIFYVFPSEIKRGRGQYCSNACFGLDHTKDRNHRWSGGVWNCPNGYRYILLPNHPRANRDGYVREHIVIMETFLNRSLIDGEIVHHINGKRDDNRIENLQILNIHTHPSLHNTIETPLNNKKLLEKELLSGISLRAIERKYNLTHGLVRSRIDKFGLSSRRIKIRKSCKRTPLYIQ